MECKFKTATIVGWHGYQNTGDDAMLCVIIESLNKRLSIDHFDVLTDKSNIPDLPLKNIHIKPIYRLGQNQILHKNINKIFRILSAKNSNILVYGGGSIFHSENSVKWKHDMLKAARSKDPSHVAICMGVSLGPFKSSVAEQMCALFLADINCILVRDLPSYEFAAQHMPKDRLFLTNDLALALNQTDALKAQPIPKKKILSNTRKTLGISLKPHPNGEKATLDLTREVAKSISILCNNNSVDDVLFFSFCGNKTHGDDYIYKHLCNEIEGNLNIRFFPYSNSPYQYIEVIGQCNFFLGMRLHSQVYSYIAQTPFAGIIYGRKCKDFMKMAGVPDEAILELGDANAPNIVKTLELSKEKYSHYIFNSSESSLKTITTINHFFDYLDRFTND